MKRFIKSNLKVFIAVILTAITCIGGSVYAAIKIQASEIEYNGIPVDQVLDDLYEKSSGGLKLCKFVDGTHGAEGNVGSKYECKLGDGETRYFYILTANSNNTVDMIMDRNINNGTVDKNTASNYFVTGEGSSYYNLWKNVIDIKLPSAISLVKTTSNQNWKISDSIVCLGTGVQDLNQGPWCNPSPHAAWLFDYLKGSTSFGGNNTIDSDVYGYWASELKTNTSTSWGVDYRGVVAPTSTDSAQYNGIRPVITVLKSSLYK